MNAQPALLPVSFRGDTVFLAEHNGYPYVPIRPIAENLGLGWGSMTQKLRDPRWGGYVIVTPSVGGPQKTLCLPLRKLTAWLLSISPAKIRPEIRPKLEVYQEECDEALWNYWSKGHAVNPRVKPRDGMALLGELVVELQVCTAALREFNGHRRDDDVPEVVVSRYAARRQILKYMNDLRLKKNWSQNKAIENMLAMSASGTLPEAIQQVVMAANGHAGGKQGRRLSKRTLCRWKSEMGGTRLN